MRLLYGTVSSDCKWLALGAAPGNPQKLFQFGGEAMIPVQIRGQYVRAGNKPLEGHLLIESNGGNVNVTVRLDVPPKAYPNGVLAGATTPRLIAEKALAAPKDAAPLLKTGRSRSGSARMVGPILSRGRRPRASGRCSNSLKRSAWPRRLRSKSATLRWPCAATSAKPTASVGAKNAGETARLRSRRLRSTLAGRRPLDAERPQCGHPSIGALRAQSAGRNADGNVRVTANGNQRFKVAVSLEIGGQAPDDATAFRSGGRGSQAIPEVQPIPVPSSGPLPMIPIQSRAAKMEEELPAVAVIEDASRRGRPFAAVGDCRSLCACL